jgi:endoplasmic reticulum-Golgi intermediate compartment protein 3
MKEEVQNTKAENTTVASSNQLALPKCGSCFGAEHNSTHCCNTCADVVAAYREKRWNPNLEGTSF